MSIQAQQINQWLNELSQGSAEPLTLDEDGRCTLVADDVELVVSTTPTSDQFFINLSVVDLPESGQELFYRQALTFNLFQQDTRGASLAIDPQSNEMVLCYTHAIEGTELNHFNNIVQNLIETTKSLRTQLEQTVRDAANAPQPSAPAAPAPQASDYAPAPAMSGHAPDHLVHFMNMA
ncbi:Type III secretion system chaperone [Sulfidibacter corallicola]|uniref:Type III secretion system chaperone n=1 Tax=Sulfidibacter corallicola TaxID=2818388 RepID=A0A8A4TR20_SULCO|nr:CesT family type III secretion system chaperone [Sulfidibacter corallicola]QTD48965.1 type III secretion system chaperone [Sulfidibacter corallicola]